MLGGLVFALLGGVSALFMAWVYNQVARRVGGLQLEVAFGRDGAGKARGVPPSVGSMMSHDQ